MSSQTTNILRLHTDNTQRTRDTVLVNRGRLDLMMHSVVEDCHTAQMLTHCLRHEHLGKVVHIGPGCEEPVGEVLRVLARLNEKIGMKVELVQEQLAAF